MIDERLKVTEEILGELRRLKAEDGADATGMIWFLYRAGLPKPGALIALRRAGVMPAEQTKLAVHTHEAYAVRRSQDEAFEESICTQLLKEDNAAAA